METSRIVDDTEPEPAILYYYERIGENARKVFVQQDLGNGYS